LFDLDSWIPVITNQTGFEFTFWELDTNGVPTRQIGDVDPDEIYKYKNIFFPYKPIYLFGFLW
jgi:hypothetical protein